MKLSKIPLIILLFITSNLTVFAQNITLPDLQGLPGFNSENAPNWRLEWQDDFSSFDPNKWEKSHHHDQWGDSPFVKLEDNVSITPQGYLEIEIKTEQYRCPDGSYYCVTQNNTSDTNFHYDYTVGQITSKCDNGYDFTNGYAEARIKFPIIDGSWCSFWTYHSECCPIQPNEGEIDIVELWGSNSSWLEDEFETNLHLCYGHNDPNCDSSNRETYQYPSGVLSQWNVYGVYKDEQELRYYFNGNLIRTLPNHQIHEPVDLILNAWTGKSFSGTLNTSMYIDWVRVWSYEDAACVSNTIEPYLVNSTTDPDDLSRSKVDLLWQLPCGTPSNTTSTVEWGLSPGNYTDSETLADNGSDHLYNLRIADLQAETQYYYKVTIEEGQNVIDTYTGSFLSAPGQSATTTTFYATGSKASYNSSASQAEHDDVYESILNDAYTSPSAQTFLIQTAPFVSGDNTIYWAEEYFNSDNINAQELRANLPVFSPMSLNQREINVLDINNNVVFELPDYRGQNYRSYFPYDYTSPYINQNGDFSYHFAVDYGPVHLNFPEVVYEDTDPNYEGITPSDVFLQNTNNDWKILSFNKTLKSLNGELLNSSAIQEIRQKAINHNVQLVLMSSENYYAHWVDAGIHFMVLGNGGVTTDGVDDQKIVDNELVYASTVPHYAKFQIEDDMMYVDVIQGADYNGYAKGRLIERFAIPQSIIIDNNTTWQANSGYPIMNDFTMVASGSTLDILSEVQFVDGGLLRVYGGGRLDLTSSSTLLTTHPGFSEMIDLKTYDNQGNLMNSYTDNFVKDPVYWSGVQIKGNPYLSQHSNPQQQGKVTISNNATIQHAECGVHIYEEMQGGQKKGGGILIADGGQFIDNATGIKMQPYENVFQHPNGKTLTLADRTRIQSSTFKTTNSFIDEMKSIRHVELYGVNRVLIEDNTFINENTSLSLHRKGTGVFASGATFRIADKNPLMHPKTKNVFQNLYYGVKAYSTMQDGIMSIRENEFLDVYRSIYLNNSKSAEVSHNKIEIPPKNLNLLYGSPYGVYLEGGVEFKVEENNISSNSQVIDDYGYGIIIHNAGAYNHEIYKNNFEDLLVGIQAQGHNRGLYSGSSSPDIGLRLICNEHDNRKYDVSVIGKEFYNNIPGIGIAKHQVVSVWDDALSDWVPYPAGNIFTSPRTGYNPQDFDLDFSNQDAEHLNYYCYEHATEKEEPYLYSNITNVKHQYPHSCLSKDFIVGELSLNDFYTQLGGAQVALNSSRLILNIWENGGDADLDEEVETTAPWEVYEQFNDLMAESPYLSEDVIISVIENLSFTDLMVKLLMIANPHVIESDEVMDALYDREPPMPESYIDQILAEEGSISQLTLLRADVAADYHLVRNTGESIKRNYRRDTVNDYALDSLINFVSRQDELTDRYELADIYLTNGMFDDMQNCLDDIPNQFELSDQEYDDHQNYLDLYAIAEDLAELGTSIGQLDSNEVSLLNTIAGLNRPGISQMAVALLKANDPDEFIWDEIILAPDPGGEKSGQDNTKDKPAISQKVFSIYPNPASSFVTVAYTVEENLHKQLSVVVHGSDGSKVIEQNLYGYTNEVIVDLTKLSSGIYTVSLMGDGKRIATEKLNLLD